MISCENSTLNYCSPSAVQSLTVVHFGSEKFDSSLFNHIENYSKDHERGGVKPDGGLWSSPVNSDYGFESYCLNEGISKKLTKSFHLQFISTARIILIDSYQDLEKLPKRVDRYEWVDWEKISELCDAVWLTEKGLDETILSSPYHLCGWDCESVLIMNPECCYSV